MFKINRVKALRIVLLGALVNLFLYLGVSKGGVIRLISMMFLNMEKLFLTSKSLEMFSGLTREEILNPGTKFIL